MAYVGNRKGELTIYDIRMFKILKKIDALESSVKEITIDPEEYYISTGSSEGNIKVSNRLIHLGTRELVRKEIAYYSRYGI